MGRSSLPYASSGRSGHFFLALIVVVGIQVFLLLTTTTCFFPVVVTTTTRTTRNNINDDDAFTFIPSNVISTKTTTMISFGRRGEGRQQHQKGAFRRRSRDEDTKNKKMISSFVISSKEDDNDHESESEIEIENQGQQQLWDKLSALTLMATDMRKSVSFYETLGLVISYGGPDADFTTLNPPPPTSSSSLSLSSSSSLYVNLINNPNYNNNTNNNTTNNRWGRCVIYVSDVDDMYHRAIKGGLKPEFTPRDASWGERYFHILDPSGHELSFAKKL
jgi:catechol 2,3-dioxygenase-like lactoylglutathione lyase family enzyme